ncbi:multicopper oxidase family protein [Pelagibius litoralis]|uniref:Multicopper oxidase family protein n=1 Tax=Pelagibius litoralis TaxID=374515 RepID=A0A967EYZ9_9PROT|nr:multicopper oxidase family protein [Pelagibius litoralis]NIA70031.1 multicopper oxidase family protein [Pelagibius litoralis]
MRYSLPSLNRRQFVGGLGIAAIGLGLPRLGNPAAAATMQQLTAIPGEAHLLEPGQPATRIWSYDGLSPGPILRVRQGEELAVRLRNDLPQPTTLHWHGIRIDNAMDGVAGLTQEAVPPGESFDYRFRVPDAGTFWYHPHNRSWEQVARGLYGLLIVDEREPNQHFDRDIAIVADDWRLGDDGQIDEASFGRMMDWSHAGRLGNTLTLNGRDMLETQVTQGERLRLRLCNTCTARILELRIEDHVVWLMAEDGQPVAPRELTDGYIRLSPGERADLLIDMDLGPGNTAAITEVSRGQRLVAGRLVYHPTARLTRAAPLPTPPHPLPANPLPAQLDLASAQAVDLLMEGGAMGNLAQAVHKGEAMDIRRLVSNGLVWSFNGVAGMAEAPLFSAARGRTVTMDLRNDTRWPHAIHLHGHHVRVIERNGKAGSSDAWKDTVLVDPLERAKIAFVADNPGKWMIHCHMLEHQAAGMATWFTVEG